MRLAEVPVPRPGPNDVLIRVIASTVSAADHRMRARDLPPGIGLLAIPVGLFRPRRRVLGMDFAGTVAAVGTEVTRYVDTGRKRGSVIVQIAPPHRQAAALTFAMAERA